jgi:DNA-directed RNA polymerase subunit RPC12/RpoP
MKIGNKKLVAAVTILILAGLIAYATRSRNYGVGSIKRGTMIWVKCANCGAEYQVDKKDFFVAVKKHCKPMESPRIPCRECGELSAYRAVKCVKCGKVFFYGIVPNDFADRCPECGYSKAEELQNTYRNK